MNPDHDHKQLDPLEWIEMWVTEMGYSAFRTERDAAYLTQRDSLEALRELVRMDECLAF